MQPHLQVLPEPHCSAGGGRCVLSDTDGFSARGGDQGPRPRCRFLVGNVPTARGQSPDAVAEGNKQGLRSWRLLWGWVRSMASPFSCPLTVDTRVA